MDDTKKLRVIASVIVCLLAFGAMLAIYLFVSNRTITPLQETVIEITATYTEIATIQPTTPAPTTPAATSELQPIPTITGFSTQGDQAAFIDDVTIPDGTIIAPGDIFTKTWRLKNSGTTTWTPGYSVVFAGGAKMMDAATAPLTEDVPPGGTLDVSLVLSAPIQTGSHTANFLLVNNSTQRFGIGVQNDPFFVQIDVIADSEQATGESTGGAHLVAAGETVDSIARLYGLKPENLRNANYMIGNALIPGQRLTLPAPNLNVSLPPYKFSVLEGNLESAYPRSITAGLFTLHYSPSTYPDQDPQILVKLIQRGLENDESLFQVRLTNHFDVYAAGSLFAQPNRTLRGRSFSQNLRYHFVHDGTGNAADQQYIAAHELTHLFTWNTFGKPVSMMLSEGAAVYAGMNLIQDSAYMPLDSFCAAYLQAGELPRLTITNSYTGHNLDLQNYYAAGCFVGYLIKTYGASAFRQLYSSGNYEGIYGKSLAVLEQEWRGNLAGVAVLPGIEPQLLVQAVKKVTGAYGSFFSNFSGTDRQIAAYRELDLARLALLEGRLTDVDIQMEKFNAILSGN